MTSKTVRLKYLCAEPAAYGVGVSVDDYTTEGIRLIRTSDITEDGDLIPAGHGVFVDPALAQEHELRDGDLLFSRSGTLGRSLLYGRERHGSCTFAQYLVRFRPHPDVDPRFLYYFSKSQPFHDQVNLDATQSTIANFNAQRFSNLQLPYHSPDQQRAIADFLDRETTRIERILALLAGTSSGGSASSERTLAGLLRERRGAIVTRAVTGQAVERMQQTQRPHA